MSTEQKEKLKRLLKTYKKANSRLLRELENMGFKTKIGKTHIKLYYESNIFVMGKTCSDVRAGLNLYTNIVRRI